MTQIYCENDGCAVREILVHTRDHLEDKPVKDPTGWRCPVCGGKVTVHWHRTGGEYQQHALEEAIGLVNSALYRREHSGEIGQPVSVLMLTELPESWKCVEK